MCVRMRLDAPGAFDHNRNADFCEALILVFGGAAVVGWLLDSLNRCYSGDCHGSALAGIIVLGVSILVGICVYLCHHYEKSHDLSNSAHVYPMFEVQDPPPVAPSQQSTMPVAQVLNNSNLTSVTTHTPPSTDLHYQQEP
jgi:hypothetical protein